MEIEVIPSPKAPVTAPAAPIARAPGAPTADELQRRTFEAMDWGAPPKPPTAEPVAAPSPAPAAVPAPVAIPSMSNEELIQRTAVAVAHAMAPAARPQPTPAATRSSNDAEQAVIDAMGEEDREDFEAVEFLEQTNPSMKGIRARYLAYVADVYAYQDQWLEGHAGQDFDPDAEEHGAWYDAHACPVDRRALDRAKVDLAAERIYDKRMEPELKRLKEKEEQRDQEEKAAAVWDAKKSEVILFANKKVLELIRLVAPEMALLLVDANGLPALSDENCQRADEYDPITYQAVNVAAERLWQMIVALERTAIPELKEKLAPTKNATHSAIVQAQREEETRILATPAEANANGQRFVTVEDFNRTPVAERAGLRCLTIDDMEALIVKTSAEQAKKAIENLDSLAKRKYGGATRTPPARPTQTAKPALPAANPQRRTVSPSISSTSDVVTGDGTLRNPPKTYGEAAVQDHFGR